MGRGDETRPATSEIIDATQNVKRSKGCLHPDASPETCSKRIVHAHTVQRRLLKSIARDGKVYSLSPEYGAILKTKGQLVPQLVGLKQASVFTGFCEKHDSALFAPVEQSPVCATDEHACLLAFRAFAREYRAKQDAVELCDFMGTLDRGLPLKGQVGLQRLKAGAVLGFSSALKDSELVRARFDVMLRQHQYDVMKFYVFWFARPPDVMCSGCTDPDWGFDANEIQDLFDLSKRIDNIFVTSLASGGLGCVFFAWLQEHQASCLPFIRSLLALRPDEVPHALIRYMFSCFDNLCIRPDWWEGLDQAARSALLRRLPLGADPLVEIPGDYLCDDGVRAVDWQLMKTETNVKELV